MTMRLIEILRNREHKKVKNIAWVFHHCYFSKKLGRTIDGPYHDRKKFMRSLCKKAGVKYFRFHPIRHADASLMDQLNIPITSIQEILGHENRRTTEIYIHSNNQEHKNAMALYETELLNSKHGQFK